nr:phosphatase PAP2 family protein [Gemella sp. zg-1178]
MAIAIIYPKNLFDFILTDMITSIFKNSIFLTLAKFISHLLHDKILLLLMGILGIFLFFIKEYKKSIFILGSAFFSASITLILKHIIGRVRPLPDVFSGGSFPSGHSVVVVVFFMALIFVINKKNLLKKLFTVSIILIGFSRLVLGAHYFTDVLAGMLLGSIFIDLMKEYYLKLYTIFSNITGLEDE